jgi:hypothetical protein
LPRQPGLSDQRLGVIRWSTVGFVWLCGLAAGLCAVLAAAAKYGCMSGDRAVGCTTSGSLLGIALLVAIIVILTVVTLMTANRPAARVLVIGAVGVGCLAICAVAAASVLATT